MRNQLAAFSLISISTLALGACQNEKPAPTEAPAVVETVEAPDMNSGVNEEKKSPEQTDSKYSAWQGKWSGPEGLFVEITPLEPGQYQLVMQSDLDTKGTYTGTDDEQGIKFTRNGTELTLRKASGDETGLKWLAGKSECLMVKQGEGYCR